MIWQCHDQDQDQVREKAKMLPFNIGFTLLYSKDGINQYQLWLTLYTDVCKHCIYQHFPEFYVDKNHRHSTRVGFEPTTFALLEHCLITRLGV